MERLNLAGCIVCAALVGSHIRAAAVEPGGSPAAQPTPIIHRMHRVPVDSGAITAIGYHRKTSTLEIRFHSGAIYRYAKVASEVFQEFISAPSKGRYFRDEIRGRYRYWRVEN